MGNFYQHKSWALHVASLFFIVVIYSTYQNLELITSTLGTEDRGVSLFWLTASLFLFVFGNVLPDIDHHKSEVERLFRIGLPIVTFVTFFAAWVDMGNTIRERRPSLAGVFGFHPVFMGLLVSSFLTLATYWGYQEYRKHARHWERTHSILTGFLFGIIIYIPLSLSGATLFWKQFGAWSLIAGFWTHLACDQFYHRIRGKSWRLRAFKLWANDWDPYKIDYPLLGVLGFALVVALLMRISPYIQWLYDLVGDHPEIATLKAMMAFGSLIVSVGLLVWFVLLVALTDEVAEDKSGRKWKLKMPSRFLVYIVYFAMVVLTIWYYYLDFQMVVFGKDLWVPSQAIAAWIFGLMAFLALNLRGYYIVATRSKNQAVPSIFRPRWLLYLIIPLFYSCLVYKEGMLLFEKWVPLWFLAFALAATVAFVVQYSKGIEVLESEHQGKNILRKDQEKLLWSDTRSRRSFIISSAIFPLLYFFQMISGLELPAYDWTLRGALVIMIAGIGLGFLAFSPSDTDMPKESKSKKPKPVKRTKKDMGLQLVFKIEQFVVDFDLQKEKRIAVGKSIKMEKLRAEFWLVIQGDGIIFKDDFSQSFGPEHIIWNLEGEDLELKNTGQIEIVLAPIQGKREVEE